MDTAPISDQELPPVLELPRLDHGDWWKELDLPLEWEALLPGSGLHAEVGFGDGAFLASMAESDPAGRYVGVERYAEGHRRFLKKIRERGLRNACSLVGDAYVALRLAFADSCLDTLTTNFSDPWPKERHAARRLLTGEFFGIAARKLKAGGLLYASTDDLPYARQAAEALDGTAGLESTHPDAPWLAVSPHGIPTRYEEKWILEGRSLHYFVYRRRKDPCPT